MPRPLLYEVNARCWLRRLTEQARRPVQLGNIPESEITRWQELGVTHLWLMGAWSTSPNSRKAYLNQPGIAEQLRRTLPQWTPGDVVASPYAISSYTVPEEFGGENGLADFRATLHRRNIRLILDFVPNHVGLDHPWLVQHPERFVQSAEPRAGSFAVEADAATRWVAHGKDPYFPPWMDTAQLDLRIEETQQALVRDLQEVARRCDGARCDMAMLVLGDVFESTWQHLPPLRPRASGEFWSRAIHAVRRDDFMFIAEAYWDLEPRLIELGFDCAYDKKVTDFLMAGRWQELESHLARRGSPQLRHGIHFLENHDEPRVADRLSLDRHALAAFVITALPGLCLIHEGQLHGARVHAPVHLARTPDEPADPNVAELYRDLFATWKQAGIGEAQGTLLATTPMIIVHWPAAPSRHTLAIINGSDSVQETTLQLPFQFGGRTPMRVRSLRRQPSSCAAQVSVAHGELAVRLGERSFDLVELLLAAESTRLKR